MDRSIRLYDLKNPLNLARLEDILRDLYRRVDSVLIVTTDPNGSLTGNQEQLLVYNNAGAYSLKINTDGGTTWTTL